MTVFNRSIIIPNYGAGTGLALYVPPGDHFVWFGVVDTTKLDEVNVDMASSLFKRIDHDKLLKMRLLLLDLRYGKVGMPDYEDSYSTNNDNRINLGEFTVKFYNYEIIIKDNSVALKTVVTMNNGDYDTLLNGFLNL